MNKDTNCKDVVGQFVNNIPNCMVLNAPHFTAHQADRAKLNNKRSHDMTKLKNPLLTVTFLYFICYLFRFIEYFFIQTDRTFWGEAFLHKAMGIVVLCVVARLLSLRFRDIGFAKNDILKHTFGGLAFGLLVFWVAYGAEILITSLSGHFHTLRLYISSYTMDGNIGNQTGLLFFAICIMGNVINVLMEEGIFRGLFQKMLEQKYKFIISAILASGLFGLWHVIAPIRQFYEGGSIGSMIANLAMLVITTSLGGFKFALLTKMTGSLYMAMGDHFVNNTIVNMLHVVSDSGADELMFVRMSIAQTLSFVIVLIVYLKKRHITVVQVKKPSYISVL